MSDSEFQRIEALYLEAVKRGAALEEKYESLRAQRDAAVEALNAVVGPRAPGDTYRTMPPSARPWWYAKVEAALLLLARGTP